MSEGITPEMDEALKDVTSGEASAPEAPEAKPTAEKAAEEKKEKASKKKSSASLEKEIKKLKKEIEELKTANKGLQEKADEQTDLYIRKHAEFENFRRRLTKDKEEAVRYANTVLLQDLITVIDDFERAILSSEESKDFDTFFSGVQMIEKQLVSTLESKYSLKRFESKGEVFDPQKHEAVMMGPAAGPEQVVLEDFQKGYMIGDRVLRHAKVMVSTPGEPLAEVDLNDETDNPDETPDESGK